MALLAIASLLAAACRKPAPSADAGAPPPVADAAPSARVGARPAVSASAAPDVVTSASEQAYADGGVISGGEIDGNSLRARHRKSIGEDRSPVTVLQGGSPLALGQRLCEAVVPKRPKETPILIKPNLGGFEWFKDPKKSGGDDGVHGRTTDVEFVRGIVRCLVARGHRAITIAEGFGHTHDSWKKLVKISGYEAMAQEEGVKLVAMDDDGVFDVEGDQPGKPLRVKGMEKTLAPTLLVPKILAEHLERGLFISAPKIKAHRFGVVTMGIKGMQGTVMLSDASPAFHQKWRMHKELSPALKLLQTDRAAGEEAYVKSLEIFAERMSDLLEISAPDVVLAEGAPAMGGDGFGKRWPSDEDVAIGGTNPILVDRVGAELLGLWDSDDLARVLGGHRTSPLIEAAAKRFAVDATSPTIVGDGAPLLATKRPVHLVGMSGFTLHSDDRAPEAFPGAPRIGRAPHGSDAPDEGDAGVSEGGAPTAADDDGRPIARAIRITDEAITVDARRDAAWDAATPIVFDTDWSGKATGTKTTVRLAASPHALFALFELEGADVHADASRPKDVDRDKLYEEDCVELFVGGDSNVRSRYWEIEIGPHGHFLDLAVDREAKGAARSDVAWSSRPTIATAIDRDRRRVTIEAAFRAPDLVRSLTKGARLPIAVYRMEGKAPRQYLAWSPTRTPKPNFHVPTAFGTLALE